MQLLRCHRSPPNEVSKIFTFRTNYRNSKHPSSVLEKFGTLLGAAHMLSLLVLPSRASWGLIQRAEEGGNASKKAQILEILESDHFSRLFGTCLLISGWMWKSLNRDGCQWLWGGTELSELVTINSESGQQLKAPELCRTLQAVSFKCQKASFTGA